MIGNHNKKIIQLLLVFIICNIYFSADAKHICEGIKGGIYFSVNVIPKNISYNLDITQNDLNRLAGKNFGKYKNYRVLGLTSTKQSISANMRGQTSQIPSGLFCFRLTSVDIKIKMLKLDVYVLGKYARGSCQYAAIIDHEHEHVSIYQTGIRTMEQAFKNKLGYIIRNLPPGIANTSDKAGEIVFSKMREKINQIKLPIEREMKFRDRQIDTPQSYKRLTQKCSKW